MTLEIQGPGPTVTEENLAVLEKRLGHAFP